MEGKVYIYGFGMLDSIHYEDVEMQLHRGRYDSHRKKADELWDKALNQDIGPEEYPRRNSDPIYRSCYAEKNLMDEAQLDILKRIRQLLNKSRSA